MAAAPPSFLSLPFSIRREIYILAGLSRLCPLAIVQEGSALRRPQQWERLDLLGHVAWRRIECRYKRQLLEGFNGTLQPEPDCACPEIPKQLLLVSKAVYNEARSILYGENSFVVRAHEAKDLAILKALSSRSVLDMTSLMVRLNCWPCRRGHDGINTRGKCLVCRADVTSDPPLRAGRCQTVEMIDSWAELCRILESNVTPGRLHLTFICDVEDIETANQIVRPLENLPLLESCAIRLGRKANHELRSLAREISLELTAANRIAERASSQTTFADLPRELRLRILEFTHLGPGGPFCQKYIDLLIQDKTLVERQISVRSFVMNKTCCNACNFTKKDCCCPLRYAAYSPSCQCRVLPLELMLVSRQMNRDASEILYANNTFIFDDSFGSTLEFLKSLRPATLKLFRRITFRLYEEQTEDWSQQAEAWTLLTQFIRNHFSIPKLIVTIDTTCDCETALWADKDPKILSPMRETYIGLTQVVRDQLSGLRGYHLELGTQEELASTLEKEVMGPEWDVLRSTD